MSRLIDAEGSELQTQLKIIREAEYQIYGSGSWGFTAKCEHAIEYAPTIQPEPKRGKWNRLDMDTFNCNQCGTTFVLNQGSEKMHFCPNCGADMREVTT